MAAVWRAIPACFRFAFIVSAVNVSIFTALRLWFFFIFRGEAHGAPLGDLGFAFYLGLKFDLRLALLLCLPVLALSWIPGLRLRRGGFGRRVWLAYLVASQIPVLIIYAVDLGNFSYLRMRLNATILSLLEAPDVALRMVWETYPVLWGSVGIVLYSGLYVWVIKRLAFPCLDEPAESSSRWGRWLAAVLSVAFLAMGIYGKWSWYPLRWSDAFFSTHSFVSQLALNPVLYFADTLENKEEDYDENEVRKTYDEVAEYLGVSERDEKKLAFRRTANPEPRIEGRPNVVVIFMERFAAFKVGIHGNALNPTPYFDALAQAGLRFTNFYVPMENTSRSLFGALFGIPDVSTRRSSSRNPLIVDQHTILNAFEGYEKMYFLGGSATWGNIRGMLAHNVPGLKIYEEGSYESPRSDVWGISDFDLFEEANRVLRARSEKPFFAIIQTAGSHRPFTIPKNAGNFKRAQIDDTTLRRHGFFSLAEYNAVRFLDHSLGHFMHLAREEAYFENTLFFILGDHGTPGGAPQLLYGDLDLASVHVPFVIYGPAFLSEGEGINIVASELDFMPTVARFLGIPHVNTTLGRDLFDERFDADRFAFTFTPFRNPPRIGLIDDEFYINIEADGAYALYRHRSEAPATDVKDMYPEQAARMARLCHGLHETAKYMLHHNKKPAVAAP